MSSDPQNAWEDEAVGYRDRSFSDDPKITK